MNVAVPSGDSRLWPDGEIYYTFDSAVFDTTAAVRAGFDQTTCESVASAPSGSEFARPDEQCQMFAMLFRAMDEWERSVPGVRFLPWSSGERIDFTSKNNGECSYNPGLGSVGMAKTTNDVNVSCGNRDTLVHELGHALGFKHTHQRTDRDDHIDYRHSCLPGAGGSHWQYDKLGSSWEDLGPFDVDSIMVYPSYNNVATRSTSGQPDRVRLWTDADGHEHLEFELGSLWSGAMYQHPAVQSGFGNSVTITVGNGSKTLIEDGASTEQSMRVLTSARTGDPLDEWTVDIIASTVLSDTTQANVENKDYWTISYSGMALDCPILARLAPDDITSSTEATWFRSGAISTTDISAATHMYPADTSGFAPAASGERFGAHIATGDFDGDGLEDAAFSSQDGLLIYRGVYTADATGATTLVPWIHDVRTSPTSLAAGDFDGDGADDLVVGFSAACAGMGGFEVLVGGGAAMDATRGALELSFGMCPSAGSTIPQPTAVDSFGRVVHVDTSGDPAPHVLSSGAEVAATAVVGDVNDDGIDDLLIGAPGASSIRSSMSVDGTVTGADFDTGSVLVYEGGPLDVAVVPDSSAFAGGVVPAGGATFSYLIERELVDGRIETVEVIYVAAGGQTLADVLAGLEGAHSSLPPSERNRFESAAVDSTRDAVVLTHKVGKTDSVRPGLNTSTTRLSPLSFDRQLSPNDFKQVRSFGILMPDRSAGHVRGSHDGARFGEAIVAADFDGDGCTDIAVGAPEDHRWVYDSTWGYPSTVSPRVGQVYVYMSGSDGCSAGFSPEAPVLWTVDLAGARTGEALAAGNVIDLPDYADDLVIASPGAGTEDNLLGPGRVDIFSSRGDIVGTAGSEFVPPTVRTPTDTEDPTTSAYRSCGASPGEDFGAVLSVGRQGSISQDTLMIGSPGSDLSCGATGEGVVFVYQQYNILAEVEEPRGASNTNPGDEFGSSIAFWGPATRASEFATHHTYGTPGFLVAAPNGWGGASVSRPVSGVEDGGVVGIVRGVGGASVDDVISQEVYDEW